MIKESCSIEGCLRVREAKGYCHTHYIRWLRHGSPHARQGYDSEGRKLCARCKYPIPLEEFETCPNRYLCKKCAAARSHENREKNLEARKATELLTKLRKYGLTLEDFQEMYAIQDGKCKICGTGDPRSRGMFHIDHDHDCCSGSRSCGKCVRGLLCYSCNVGLGKFNDSPERLREAADYVEKFRINNPELIGELA
jgi:Recombination endonuclease VII